MAADEGGAVLQLYIYNAILFYNCSDGMAADEGGAVLQLYIYNAIMFYNCSDGMAADEGGAAAHHAQEAGGGHAGEGVCV